MPSGGRIVYFLSNDNGYTWTQAQLGGFVGFRSFGKTLRWSAVIARQNLDSPSPIINSVTITARESDPALARDNDQTRLQDLSRVTDAISDFYKDYGIYPHVGGTDSASRWNELMTLLLRNRNGGRESYPYLYSPINDPSKSASGVSYDYEDLSPNDYILAATLESPDNPVLNDSIRGNFRNLNCNGQVYCTGVLRSYTSVTNSTTSTTNTNTTSTNTVAGTYRTTTNLDIRNMIANPLNLLLGSEIFKFSRYAALADIFQQTTSQNTAAVANASTNTSTKASADGAPKKTDTAIRTQSALNNSGQTISADKTSRADVSRGATGTTDSLLLSLLLGGLAAFVYMNYSKTGLFKKRDALSIIKKHRSDRNKFNFV